MSQPQLLQQALSPSDIVYTPDWCARDMVEWFKPTGRILEPCMGDGAFLKYLPGAEWCEIEKGRDFFAWSEPVDWIIGNPPFTSFDSFMEHSYDLAENIVYLVPPKNLLSAHSRLVRYRERGWMKHIRFYGTGTRLNFPMGNEICAIHFQRGYMGDTSWSWYASNNRLHPTSDGQVVNP